jgi:alpha-amylase/alpha-mannosidase (GH57 family)
MVQRSVSLVGDFNGWSADATQMSQDSVGVWSVVVALPPGLFQYKFLVDGSNHVNDQHNPATIENYNRSAENSVFVLTEGGDILLAATAPESMSNPRDEYPAKEGTKPVYLNITWHQHQPSHLNPETDQLSGPWVRTHATKDYYDMVAMLRDYPNIHCTVNLTSSLLVQLQEHYVRRLAPFVDAEANTIDVDGFLASWKGKTDPWIDLALRPTADFESQDLDYLYRNSWNAFGISEVMRERFPGYEALWAKLPKDSIPSDDLYTTQELREIKFWFFLAHFDPDFLRGPVTLPDGTVCDLSDIVSETGDGHFVLSRRVTEDDCRRIVVEAYKVMANVIPMHRELLYSPSRQTGQVEIITTPYYHPILPLIYDSDLAQVCQPNDSLPARYAYPEDAQAQVQKSVSFYRETFGSAPTGMWPAEGAVAQPVLHIFRENGVLWTASDVRVLNRSVPEGQPNTTPYRFPAGEGSVALVFRDTDLSDRIGFRYQSYVGEDAAEDFVRAILSHAPAEGAPDVLITVILDGENAWEWYTKDIDGKQFLHALYRKLSKLHEMGRIITTTTTEYILGNDGRGIPTHSMEELPPMEELWPGSWINASFHTWIGERVENHAWEYLRVAREDLAASGLPAPDTRWLPRRGTKAWYAYKAWEAMYAAEGSDWFWWYGVDQTAPAGEEPFDLAFRSHLENIYRFARLAGATMPERTFESLMDLEQSTIGGDAIGAAGGTMAQASGEKISVLFTCDASNEVVLGRIYIAGNLSQMGSWVPNSLPMYDDGTHGDAAPGDSVWSLLLGLPLGELIEYKYTNSGERGKWGDSDESPGRNRTLTLSESSTTTIADIFGE